MKSFITFIAALFISVTVFADNGNKKVEKDTNAKTKVSKAAVQLAGSIIDQKNNENLAGAAVYIDGQKIYSDLDGNFNVLNIKPGVHKVKVELISYQTVEQEINVQGNNPVHINMMQK